MPKSIKSRFNGNMEEVIDYTRTWGRHKAMDKYQVRDYLAFSKFIEGETGEPNIGLRPTLGGTGTNSWSEDLLEAFSSKLLRMQAKLTEKDEVIERQRLEIEYYKNQQALKIEPKVREIMALCRS